jgi:hypothetical protein
MTPATSPMFADAYQSASAAPDGRLRVLYVAGSGHTGSTLLAMLLDAHPQIVSVGETAVKPKIRRKGHAGTQKCSCGETVHACAFWGAIFRHVTGQGHVFGLDHWTNDYRSETPIVHRLLTRETAHPVMRALQRWSEQYLPVHATRMRRTDQVNVAFVRAALDSARAQVFCDTTKHTFRLARLLALPELDVKVVTLVRDVRGYAASAKRRGYAIEDAAMSWRKDQEVIARITRPLPADRKLLVRYEDLCGDPEGTLRQLHRFCGVHEVVPRTAVNSADHHVLGNSMRLAGTVQVRLDESWRVKLASDEQRRILDIAGVMNRAMGYA